MKNIHILPTDKPSRLYEWGRKELKFTDHPITNKRIWCQNIYITSDEKIKDGDWCLDKFNQRWKLKDKKLIAFDSQGIKRFSTDNILGHECKKIILTTDKDLIGVREIDDEFLEWFVKNPSCEKVDIEKYCRNGLCDSKSRSKRDKMDEHRYEDPKDKCWYSGCQCPGERLIVPKKNFYCGDEVDYDDKCLEQCDGCVDATGIDYGYLPKEIHLEDIFNDEKKEGIKKLIQKHKLIDMMEQDEQLGLYQETLEQAPKEKLDFYQQGFADGIKIQQERSYSDMQEYATFCIECDRKEMPLLLVEDWYEHYKK